MFRALSLTVVLLTIAAQAQAGPRYVAMGSSFAAGQGLGAYEASGPARCGRSTHNYAHQFAARRGLDLVDVSCSGATTAAILAPWGEVPAQIDAVTADTRLVTVTIGGNDLGYVGGLIAASCRALNKSGCQAERVVTEADYATLKTTMAGIVDAIRARAPKATIALVQYPVVLPAKGVCAATPMSKASADAARAKASRLARITAEVAREHGARVIRADRLSRGHDACAAQPWMNGYPAPGAAPYHPNRAGMTAVAEALDKVLPR
ncbi:SGNH/GDSL hydrolase family protein [uncultured Caulobacter sp.]|uniref:SGNH/GDSL hydrolase family protein n=1 Tax=uncultured Caulobacter sp. TaxID=158749 RepID=UPI002614C12A|nr:SGNH/GDSL hydrolase family protein [uncultured Caulobacter sp.]